MTILQKLTIALLITNVLILVVVGVLLFAPVRLPIIYNEPFPVSPREVRRGETLYYTMEVDKREQYAVDVHKNIVCDDGNLVTLAPTKTNIPLGRRTITPEVIIPMKASLSTCHIEIENTYHINPLRNETLEMRTQDFIIIK